MFFASFYIFSSYLSYKDCTKFIVPNNIILVMFISLLLFGSIEQRLSISSFIMPIIVLIVFIIILLLNPKSILGGGDIKYMMVVSFFLPYLSFPLFLMITGVLQTIALIYKQKIKKRRVVAMVPLMFASVFITQIMVLFGLNPINY